MKRFIVVATDGDDKGKNLFKDGRSFAQKKTADKHRKWATWHYSPTFETQEIEVLTKEERFKEFLESELSFHEKMREQDKKDGAGVDVAFRNGIISQTRAMLSYLNQKDA